MKIRKICLVLITLFIINIGVVKAENVKIGNTNYFIGKEFYCNGQKMTPEYFIEKTGKIVVYDENNNHFIWREDGVCSVRTQQDILDDSNYPMEESDENANKFTITTKNFYYITAYITPTEFDANETYYSDEDGTIEVQNPTEDNLSTYYKKVYIRHSKTTEVDSNKTYYKHINRNHYGVADISEVNENNISDYYLLTTMDEINEVKTEYLMDRTLYDSLVGANGSTTFRKLDGQVYLVVITDDVISYYDINGVENTKYKNYLVSEFNNYLYMLNYDSGYMKITIKEKEKNNIIYEYTYNNSLNHFYAVEMGDMLVIYDYDNTGYKMTYIDKYELLEGANQTFNDNDLTIKISGNYDIFKELKINGEVVSSDNYTVSKGSTIIKISKNYLKNLKSGVNEISVVYKDGAIVTTNLTIKSNVSNPNTLDNLESYLLIGLISLIGILITSVKVKKINKNSI